MKRTPLTRRTPLAQRTELRRRTPLEPRPSLRSSRVKRSPISPATSEQRAVVRGRACIVCAQGPCHPAHLVDRSLAPAAGDNPRAVVPLCPRCHRDYDDGPLDLSPYLEPHWRESVAWAVEAVGLWRALERITKRDSLVQVLAHPQEAA